MKITKQVIISPEETEKIVLDYIKSQDEAIAFEDNDALRISCRNLRALSNAPRKFRWEITVYEERVEYTDAAGAAPRPRR
jgi:hypothetical protein